MSEKKPQPGEWWRTRGGDRRYVAAVLPEELDLNFRVISIAYDGATETHLIDGMTDDGSIEWPEDLVEHLPWCTSFDDPEPVAETWPKWYVPRDRTFIAAVCRTSDVRANVYDGKGCDVNIPMRVDTHHWLEVTESEALARLKPPAATCPQPAVVALDRPTDGLGHGFSEPDTVPIQFMVPRRVLDGGDWPVRACLAGGLVEDAATWIPVMIDRLGNTSVRKAVNQ